MTSGHHGDGRPEGVEGAIIGSALYKGAFTLPEALDIAGRP
jgi:phosphoribosylformimino-5-aminoimidazole carboxamide ribonucleotide (ProFAR) isomerase